MTDDKGNLNRFVDPARTGRHLWRFDSAVPLDLAEPWSVGWADADPAADTPTVPVVPGSFFYELKSDLPLGAIVRAGETVFRLFAPRARGVTLHLNHDLSRPGEAEAFSLRRRAEAEGVWELALDRELHGWYYWYSLDGMSGGAGSFDPAMRVLDPYALASVSHDGPGMVLDRAWVGEGDRGFRTPAWQDLVICEAHVRDLAAHAPVKATPDERLGFTGLRRWVESPEFYLHQLGVNCVELQPIQEFDNLTVEEYHWGYMTNNFFSPESSYALDPERASGVRELQDLVRAFHRRGMAVLLDVVYNHVGQPAHLLFIAKNLERVGDHAVNIAEAVEHLVGQPAVTPLPEIEEMARLARGMLSDALDHFVRGDAAGARDVCSRDDTVDALHNSLFRILLTHMMEDPRRIGPAMEFFLVSRNLERIGDLATNIAEDVVFLVEGRSIKHGAERRG